MEIHMKKCSCCKEIKDYSLFHKDSNSKTGFSTYCKSCKKIKDSALIRTSYKSTKDVWRKKFPERKSAHMKVYFALKKGLLTRLPCFICGEKSEAHHADYSRPLDVVWLCPSHHRQAHMNF